MERDSGTRRRKRDGDASSLIGKLPQHWKYKPVIVFKGRGSNSAELQWYKADISGFMDILLSEYGGRTRGEDGLSHHHCCSTSTSTSYLFPEETLVNKGNIYDAPGCEVIPSLAGSFSVDSNVYCIGGNRDIKGMHRIAVEMQGGHHGPVTEEDVEMQRARDVRDDNKDDDRMKQNLSHRMVKCYDFIREDDECIHWSAAAPLVSPRYCPKFVPVGDKVYIFGGNCPPRCEEERESVPYGEVFDPKTGLCRPLPELPHPRIGFHYLVILPLLGDQGEQKILLMSRAPCGFNIANVGLFPVYDIKDQSWTVWADPHPDFKLYENLFDMAGEPVAVAKTNTTYWLVGKSSREGKICCYNWKTKELLEGPIEGGGLEREEAFMYFSSFKKCLVHIVGDLFCLIWQGFDIPNDPQESMSAAFHLTMLYLHKNEASGCLQPFLLGCLKYKVQGIVRLYDAHLLRLRK